MTDPSKKPLQKQHSLSYVEQSLNLISPPRQAPVTIYPGPGSKVSNLSKADLEIANRLEKLRRSSQDIPTEEEMASRLALLKGLPSDYYSKPRKFHHAPDTRTQVQQSEDLLKQIMEEVSLEHKAHGHSSSDDEHTRHSAPMGFHVTPHAQPQMPLPPMAPYPPYPIPPAASGLDIDHHHIAEVDDLIKEAEKENKEGSNPSSPKGRREKRKLKKEQKKQKKSKDKDGTKEEKKKKKHFKKDKKVKSMEGAGGSSSGEYFSDSDSGAKSKKHGHSSCKEKEEVDKIVKMYSHHAIAEGHPHGDQHAHHAVAGGHPHPHPHGDQHAHGHRSSDEFSSFTEDSDSSSLLSDSSDLID